MSVINNNNSPDHLHIWDNAAFDCNDSVDAPASFRSSFESSDKENHNTNFKQNDKEIEDVEKEIHNLSHRLLELKREKMEKSVRNGESRARVAFLELDKKEIVSCGAVTRKMIKEMNANASSTPLNQKQCFWKPDQIDELKMTKKRLSLSPGANSKLVLKLPKQAATTVGSRKTLSKVDSRVSPSVLEPKNLFKEPVKKAVMKAGRIVASKYNNTGLRKRSLPECDESKGNEKKRASLGDNSSSRLEGQKSSRVKKRWEIPTEVVVFKSSNANAAGDDDDDGGDQTPPLDNLPRIRTAHCVDETPRDSGAVKRAAERKPSAFVGDDEQVCNTLTFSN